MRKPLSSEDRAILVDSQMFDADWYLAQYPDVAFSGMDPLEHFLWLGDRLNRNPGPSFDAAAYLARYHDVARAGASPVIHYIRDGRREGRIARPVAPWTASLRDEPGQDTFQRHHPGVIARRPGRRTVLLCAHVVGDTLYGSERSLLDMLNGLLGLECNVVIAVPRTNNAAYIAQLQGRCCGVIELAYGWWRAEKPLDEAVVATFARVIAEERIDILHVNTIMLREPLVAARRIGIPTLVQARELISHDEELQKAIGLDTATIIDAVWNRCDTLITNSRATAACFDTPRRKSVVVYNTADMDTLTDLPGPAHTGRLRVGMIGSNVPKKGLEDFTKVAQAVAARGVDVDFVLVGPEHEHTRKVQEAVKAGTLPATLRVTGYRDTPAKAVAETDVVLSLSQFRESFGRTVLEAAAAARPTIVYDHGAPPELVVEGQTGYVVAFRDTEAVAERICALAADRRAVLAMGLRARAHAIATFGPQSYVAAMRTAYAPYLRAADAAPGTPLPALPAPRKMTLNARALAPRIARADLKLAYFCWHFPVPSETFVLNELRVLKAQGIDVIVFCKDSPYPEFKPDFDISWETVRDADHLAQRLNDTGRTAIHGHFVFPTVTDMVWPAAEKARVPFTCIAHAQDIFRYAAAAQNRISEFARSPWCKQIFTLSRFHRQYLIDRDVPADKITINSNCIDPDLFADGKIDDRPARRARRIVAVSRFAEKKGLDILIRAGALLADMDIAIDIHGYGPLEDSYRRIIADENISNVSLHGPVEGRAALLEVFRGCDLFVCPSVRAANGDMDGLPTTLMESMAAGLPVLSTRIAGIPDLVQDGLTGLLCEATPQSLAQAVRDFYTMPKATVAAMIEDGETRLRRHHNAARLVDTLLRFWANETIDLMIVAWNNLDQLREVIRRLYENTALPFHLIVCDNGSAPLTLAHLITLQAHHDNITLIMNRENALVGPGTNLCLAAGTSDYAIYVCGKEGMTTAHAWEKSFVSYMNDHPKVGLAGTLCYSPSYLTGRDYPKGVALFDKFRNPAFATENPDREFRHVQGGFFVIRRAMIDTIGAYSADVPHDSTDVEFSYYVESMGWKLGEVPGLMALFNKTRPDLSNRVDESHGALHPPALVDLPWLDRIARVQVHHCNICATQAPLTGNWRTPWTCPGCGSHPADRSLFRVLAESSLLYRRLPALGVGVPAALDAFWKEQFQGPNLTADAFAALDVQGDPLPNRSGGLHLALLNEITLDEAPLQSLIAETARLLAPGAPLLVAGKGGDRIQAAVLAKARFVPQGQRRFSSQVIGFDRRPILLYRRSDTSSVN